VAGGTAVREFIATGFQAIIVCLDPRALDPSFAGRPYDEQLLAELPASVDPCGENGEFHTFVHAGPIFPEPIACETGELVERDGFLFCDLTPGLRRVALISDIRGEAAAKTSHLAWIDRRPAWLVQS
jgi:diphthamide synthase (EF-2-diphthine--ammonia ligase)